MRSNIERNETWPHADGICDRNFYYFCRFVRLQCSDSVKVSLVSVELDYFESERTNGEMDSLMTESDCFRGKIDDLSPKYDRPLSADRDHLFIFFVDRLFSFWNCRFIQCPWNNEVVQKDWRTLGPWLIQPVPNRKF